MTRPHPGGKRSHQSIRGFTLLEVMLSLTITAVILLMILGALRLCFRAWDKGDQAVATQQRQRLIFDRVKRQLASVVFSTSSSGDQVMVFRGDSKGMEFISRLALIPSNRQGSVGVKYIVSTDEDGNAALMFIEDPLVNYMQNGMPTDYALDNYLTLIDRLKAVRFEYFNTLAPEQPPFWQEAWDSEREEGLPGAVRIRIDGGDPSDSLTIVAPIVQGGSKDE